MEADEGDHLQEQAICVVCMEPMEWVAVSPCGHREVCVRCAASIRFFHNDLRCCICRSHCSTVVVTKASSIRASGQRDFPFLWPPPPAFASEVLVGHYFWYHRGMRAYFDDLFQYKEMKEVCSTTTTTPPPSSEESSRAAGASRYPDVSLNVSVSQRRRAAEAPVELEEPSSSDDGVSNLSAGYIGDTAYTLLLVNISIYIHIVRNHLHIIYSKFIYYIVT